MPPRPPTVPALPHGLYERLVTSDEAERIDGLVKDQRAVVTQPTQAQRREHLLNMLTARLPELLDAVSAQSESAVDAARAEIELIAALMRQARLDEVAPPGHALPAEPLQLLRAIHPPAFAPASPQTGLRKPAIFTAARHTPSLLTELQAELACADHVDIVVSFITWSGVRKLLDILKTATGADTQGFPKTRLRILTTTYIGATEVRAVDALARLPGAQVRISLDGRRNRLHAKAWMFHRLSGFGTAFVGSANLSESAMVDGIEWTVKFTQAGDPDLYATACANFETLWNDGEFQAYDPDDSAQRAALEAALGEQRKQPRQSRAASQPIALHTWFDLRPKPYQAEMLERLASERKHGRLRNLVVAATGTGKTVVAAFDYERQVNGTGSRPRLLFVAHRTQILKQALSTFRQVLRDPSFGDLMDGEHEPTQHDHLFATITTLHRRSLVAHLGPAYWQYVVVDEAHHLPAKTFDQFLNAVRPEILLGLTATPERADGKSLNLYFDSRPDGSPAVSMRLWDALDQQLLAPFEYFATADDTDLRDITWNRPEETAQLDALISSNHARGRLVTTTLERYVADLSRMKAVAFCVSVAHARFMADWFNRSGLPSVSLTGDDTGEQRDQAVRDLRAGKISLICTCDLFNEGVDIPEINTLLLLRPTQSPVVFQQQLGRGLRLSTGKESCLVLDFVGQYSAEFRFDTLLRAITGHTRAQLKNSLEGGFGYLPSGCHMQFDRIARERVLDSLRRTLQLNVVRLRQELSAWVARRGAQALTLAGFLRDNQFDISDVYANRRCWTSYRRDLRLPLPASGPREDELMRRMGSILHANDPLTLSAWREALSGGDIDPCRVQMLAYQVLHESHETMTAADFVGLMMQHPALRQEMLEIIDWLRQETVVEARTLPGVPDNWPLTLHARYERREIQTAAGHLTASARPQFREGCLPLLQARIELLFVTLDKREGFGERVQYRDYALTPERFHWQSQNKAGAANATGRRYLDSGTNGWRFQLFVRENTDSPFIALGPVTMVSHEGDRPISIVWELATPMPIEVFRRFSVLRDV